MTVLQRNTARGLGDRGKQMLVGVAVVVAGFGAAYGVSQLVDSDTGGTAHEVLVERSMAMQANIDVLERNAQAQAKALEQAAAASATGEWTLEDELEAIHSDRQVLPSEPRSGPR